MNLMTYALLKKEIQKTLINGIEISDMEIVDGDLIFTMSNNSVINAGKLPTSDQEAIENITSIVKQVEVALQDLQDNAVKQDGGIVTGPLTLLSEPTDDLHAITKAYLDKVVGDLGEDTNIVDYINKQITQEKAVVNAKTHFDFPSIGKTDVIYKAEEEKLIYQWNPNLFKYEILSEISTKVEDINLIYGGNANGI